MPRPTRKPVWRWAPLPYLLLILLMLVTGTLEDAGATDAFRVMLVVTIVAAVVLVAWFVAGVVRGPINPDHAGVIRRLDGLELDDFASSGTPPVPVVSQRRQHGVDAARAFGGEHVRAILVPRATSWWGLQHRVTVQLIAGERVFDGGFLNDQAAVTWDAPLAELRAHGRFAVVPAVIDDSSRPFRVTLDLGGLQTLRG